MADCFKCGNVGVLPNNEPCDCIFSKGQDINEGISCMSVPEMYRNVMFDVELLPTLGKSDYYKTFMGNLYKDIIHRKLKNKNMLISSPLKSGKTVFAYSCIEKLFRKGVPTFPLFDVLELSSIMKAVDVGKHPALIEDMEVVPMHVYTAPYLFVKVTHETSFQLFETMAKLVDRRTRRGNVTIFLSPYSWNYLAKADTKNILTSLSGDGSFGTIESVNF